MTTYIQLGRYGDILNVLPILWNEAQWGRHARLMVAAAYADMLDGVTYVEPVIFHGDYSHLLPAIRQAHLDTRGQVDAGVVNLQVYGKGYVQPKVAGSFCEDAWNNGDYLHLWGQLPLVLDNRNAKREAALLGRYPLPKDAVLVSARGLSSPFAHGDRLKAALRSAFGARVVDLDSIRAERPYDLLALYERAACMVAIDTMHLHLAPAVKVPTVALITPGPTPWHGTPEKAGQILRVKYDRYMEREDEVIHTVRMQLGGMKTHRPPKAQPRVVHVFPQFKVAGRDAYRHQLARRTWQRAYAANWKGMGALDGDFGRSALDVGDHRQLPFVQDLVDMGCKMAGSKGAVVLSNSDVCLSTDFAELAAVALSEHGAFYTHRWDFDRLDKELPDEDIRRGKWYPGSDCFGFTTAWWMEHGEEYPDMLMGAEFVDSVLRQLIKKHGGTELHRVVYHERHTSYWERPAHRITNPANAHNRALARAWFKANGTDDLDPFTPKQAERIRRQRVA